jgi:1,4-dihydroxy-2-naphthoyl-CoA synthase
MSNLPAFEDILYEKRERAVWVIIHPNACRAQKIEELIKAVQIADDERPPNGVPRAPRTTWVL